MREGSRPPAFAAALAGVVSILLLQAGEPASAVATGISARPDLVVTKLTTSRRARPGGVVVVKHRLHNAGGGRAHGSTVGYYLRSSRRGARRGASLTARRLPALAPGRSVRRAARLIVPTRLAPGSYVVVVCADIRHRVAESREANNCRSSARLTLPRQKQGAAPAAPTVTAHPTDPTNSTGARFAFTIPESGLTFLCSIDSGTFTPCLSPIEYSGLSEGAHTFAVRALSADGRSGPPATFAWTIDISPPHPPWFTSVPDDPTRSRSASFSFASVAEATFTCRLDDAAFAPCTSPTSFVGPLAEGSHPFAVQAHDAVGNVSPATTFSWAIDLTPPAAPVLLEHPDDPTNDTQARFTFAGAPEPGGRWLCRLDGDSAVPCANPQVFPGPLSQGEHEFVATARDAAGNESETETTFAWTIDTTPPPRPQITGQPDNPSGPGTSTFTFTDAEPGVTFRCRLDGGAIEWCPSPHSYNGLPDGERLWELFARDEAGNWSLPGTYRWMIDTTPPPAAAFDFGVFAGGRNPAGVVTFQNWLRRPMARVLEYLGYETWAEIDQPIQIATWQGTGYNMVYSVPMLPQSGATIQQGATGAYNIHFQLLAQRLVAAGQGNAVIRLGWEFNGNWYPWTAMNDPTSFIQYWRQIVTTMRAVPGSQLKFDWCTVFGPASMPADAAYPGDAYVDYIGMSVFDQDWYPGWEDPQLRWRNFITLPFGLQWQRDFARAHTKQMVFDEWALSERDDGHGGGDNPYYVQQMYRWFNALDRLADSRPRVAWGNYFEFDKPDSRHRLTGTNFPQSAIRTRALFGNVF